VAFVVLLLLGEAMVSLPRASHRTAFLSEYYAQHSSVITFAQVVQLVAAVPFFLFARALSRRAAIGHAADWVARTGVLVVVTSVLTVAPVLTLALEPDLSADSTRTLAIWTDLTDVTLFFAIGCFAVACRQAFAPGWLRLSAEVLAGLSLAHAVLSLWRIEALDVIAPLAFVVFVLALSGWMLRERLPSVE